MRPLILAYPGNESLGTKLAKLLAGDLAEFRLRKFPDGESYVQFLKSPKGRELMVLCSLDRPDAKILPLIFLAETARELGATSVGLVAPYLSYLRQDRRFHEGEGVTSRYFSKLLSAYLDGLVTVDPHLHRIPELSQIYSIPTRVVHAAPEISRWLKANVERPFLIGPDSESQQWVEGIATSLGAPFVVCQKERLGDREVKVIVPLDHLDSNHTPVLVDDIISTGRSMVAALVKIKAVTKITPVCIGVHAVFAQHAHRELLAAGAKRVVTCNTIAHPSNDIDLSLPLSEAVQSLNHQKPGKTEEPR